MAKITIDNRDFELHKSEDGTIMSNGEALKYDLIRLNKDHYHLLINHNSYNIQIIGKDKLSGSLLLRVNGRNVEGRLAYKIEQVLKSMGMDNSKKIHKDIKAPMPGLVLDVLVSEGQEVKEGDDLVILEAMKMENALKAPQDGIIELVKVSKQDKVDKNQLLVSYK